jgi:hypothetical protein
MQGLAGVGAGAVRQDQAHFSPSGTGTGAAKRGAPGRRVDSHDEGQGTNRVRLPLEDRRWQPFAGQRKRLKLLRGFRGAALPGQSLVV